MKKHIPNAITLINVFAGSCALVAILNSQFMLAFYCFLVAGFADWFDGAVARILKVSSPVGKELDSLADMVSFGLLPSVIIYMLALKGMGNMNGFSWVAAPAFLLAAFSALRLARFNLDERQTADFIGLATPASTTFTIGLMLIYHFDSFGLADFVTNQWFLYGVVLVFSYLLNSEIPMFSFKFKSLNWKGNEIRITFVIISLISLVLIKEVAFSLNIVIYIILNLILKIFKPQHS